ncbi:class I SAM-dependent methyltransferase [Neolewinella litorea]|uniref:Class I SAM-dependent methyltransferase n=1 Tax=Neolewinella litorea TaxID=2562452 RepID=A0A4S4NMZ8_9BACT|nr:class I SAM-dependent methyltransferase [Neolewinella litorea]THH40347.1 class I SAM-dependent methyltransferase [Neolewinella litorea]
MDSPNDLQRYFTNNTSRVTNKWDHYFEIYDRHLQRFRGQEVVLVEIGVFQGGSLGMWQEYLGPRAKIYGIDIDPRTKALEEDNVRILIGSQSDRAFLRTVRETIPRIDILIDDGGHMMRQQITTFEELFGHVSNDGVYLCEDLHTSYWMHFGGGHQRRGTFIEFSKNLIDALNAYHSQQNSLRANELTETMHGLHFYDSILVIEKRRRSRPRPVQSGTIRIFPEEPDCHVRHGIQYQMLKTINRVLRFLRLQSFIWR